MRCFEINLMLVDGLKKRTVRQYFQHEKYGQAIQSTLAWTHLRMQEFRTKNQTWVIDGLAIHEWRIDVPESNGEIKTCKFLNSVLKWSAENGVVEIYEKLTEKQKKWMLPTIQKLNAYGYYQVEVKIEELASQEDMADGEKSFGIYGEQ